ncbi:MAG TPA: alpha/beta hydrolase [Acidimicrobiales bacterium]|nr:alpha/beta hydrolase [Acidimicrobiales bacterium]
MRLVPSGDGVPVAVHELGGAGPDLLIVHGTGFCAGMMAPLAAELTSSYRCAGVDLRGHGASPVVPGVGYHWHDLAGDVLAALDALEVAPAYAVGHSSGGAALLLAASRDPSRFEALWCFEPIVWPDPVALRDRAQGLAAAASRRRAVFASREEAAANFASKPPFSGFDPRVLAAYLDCGFAERADGTVELCCPPEVEAEMYRMGVTHDGFSRLPRVACPVTVARGDRSEALGQEVVVAQVAALSRGQAVELDGLGHFGPLEDPARVAAAVLDAFRSGG